MVNNSALVYYWSSRLPRCV